MPRGRATGREFTKALLREPIAGDRTRRPRTILLPKIARDGAGIGRRAEGSDPRPRPRTKRPLRKVRWDPPRLLRSVVGRATSAPKAGETHRMEGPNRRKATPGPTLRGGRPRTRGARDGSRGGRMGTKANRPYPRNLRTRDRAEVRGTRQIGASAEPTSPRLRCFGRTPLAAFPSTLGESQSKQPPADWGIVGLTARVGAPPRD